MEINSTVPLDTLVAKKHGDLRVLAEKLEATFLAEMLKSAGLGEVSETFGGGIGEEQFESFLRDHHARALASHGGLGLAEQIFKSLVAQNEAGSEK